MIHRKSQLSVPKTRNPYILYIRVCTQLHPCMWGVSRRFQAIPGGSRASRALQGPPGASRGQGASGQVARTHKRCFEQKMRPAAYSQSPEPWARLKFHAGWSGWTRPPTMAGGGGVAEACLQGRVEGFFKKSERPVAGCLGELLSLTCLQVIPT